MAGVKIQYFYDKLPPLSYYTQFRNITYSNRPERVAQLAEHWAGIPKVVGSIPTVARHIFHACPVWIYTQSNITSIDHINS